MPADPSLVFRALGLPAGTRAECEPLEPGKERWLLSPPGGGTRAVIARRDPDDEMAANNAATTDALMRAGFAAIPAIAAIIGHTVFEEEVAGATALAVAPPPGSAEAAVDALAGLHQLPLREGVRWERRPDELIPAEDPPLYRLGFAADERQMAFPAFQNARDEMLAASWGFVHGSAVARNVLLAEGRAWLIGFEEAGFGCQIYDVAAFVLTAGLDATRRRELASRYAARLVLDPHRAADLVDLAGILWGVTELLKVPRKSIELLGDDAGLAALNTLAGRIERGIREPAGNHPAAVAIRGALWPS